MAIEYFFRIETEKINHTKLDSILGFQSKMESAFWEVVLENNQEVEFFVESFVQKVLSSKNLLSKLGVNIPNDISFWCLYEYNDQCNLEFNSNILRKLGNNGIDLCISCWTVR